MKNDDFYKRKTQPGAEQAGKTPIPESISGYIIENLLEKGGMSHVYLARHPQTLQPVTVKVLSPKYLSNPEVVKRFLKEAKIIGMTDHPNIVKLYSQGEWENGLFIAMEFIEGISLRQYMQKTPIPLKKALDFILQIAYALCHLHAHGVIHRDLKLENILVTNRGTIKVIDFGIAQLLGDKRELTHPQKRIIGTPIYMSPEQKDNPESVSYPSDIYSLGIIAYELVLGKLSHGKVHLSMMPKGLKSILTKCLKPNPADRYQDIVAFIADLSEYINSEKLEEDKRETDLFSQISDEMQKTRESLTGSPLPTSPFFEIGMSLHHGMNSGGLYFDSFSMDDSSFALLIAESMSRGIKGISLNSFLKGQVRAFWTSRQPFERVFHLLNDCLTLDKSKPPAGLSVLSLNPSKNKITYNEFSYGSLWAMNSQEGQIEHISCINPLLGKSQSQKFNETSLEWRPNDRLVFVNVNFSDLEKLDSLDWKNLLKETGTLPTGRQTEIIIRKLKRHKSNENNSLIVLSIDLKKRPQP